MIVFPAIDILGGKAVRLAQGDYDRVTVYNEDPVAQAQEFLDAGAEWIHVVDLDGARDGVPGNIDVVERIARETGARLEVGGGVRSLETLSRLAEAGAERIVLGTKLATDPEFVRAAVRCCGNAVVAGVDARDGMVAVEGWREGTATSAQVLVGELRHLGIRHLVYTDIARDGMGSGLNIAATIELAEQSGIAVIASGGVRDLDHLRELARAAAASRGRVLGVITGRALYEGTLDLRSAQALLQA